jgi:hypothetical protein
LNNESGQNLGSASVHRQLMAQYFFKN